MSGWTRRPPAYQGRNAGEPSDLHEIRQGRALSVAHRPGSDLTLVFIHGTGGNRRQFDPLWTHYAETGATLLAWDAHGHGASPRFDPRLPHTLATDALLDDAETLLNRHATGTTILIGHSLGARIVLSLLLRLARTGRLGQIDAALLIAPSDLGMITRAGLFGPFARLPGPALEWLRPLAGRMFRDRAWHPDTDPALIAEQRAQTSGNSLAMITALLTQATPIDPAALAALTLPITILAGQADRLVPRDAAGTIATALPDTTIEIIPRAGHQIMLERPDACIAAIERLRAKVQP
ncbi:abhydrolase domain-containing protein 8 [Endobacter medicaginis]|uniref:Abhydrolase domain-containing protein 8 n=2 Tax=Endobacter medicaginis TaxID=1181271 RepID=A0A850NWV6_9PROT|nr:alpha/beta fold hydrolase [Endobacter medicaginis]MBB3174877.1 abhydrolase domain-containing protein 8 [Endobacter medicaginis]MCX5477260.1 alpha/beta fold hydrolase [Endobacter medicaginis]NVN32055.1 alpha/beta hydrolase [Endobacter medicaginis]